MSIYVGDKEIKNLYIGESISISDMQGPAPEGFHVPLITEWQGLKTIMDGLGLTTGDSWKINLHIPFSGARDYYSSGIRGANSFVYYWSSTPSITDKKSAYAIQIGSGINIVQYNRGYGFPIRPFYKEYIIPDSSWNVIQGTLGSAGIFWNQVDGLISITSDGTTGYTITDKNLGATTVYKNGDTLTQANMGNMYQWGNNYGFQSTGTISKTSSTQVNASSYGPGNYYESDTFITGHGDWSSVYNDNLRGGVSQGSSIEALTAKEIYLGNTKVWPSISDFYQEFVTSWHNAYLQSEQDEGDAMTALINQVNGNVEYYYNNLSAGGHINENSYSRERGLNGAIGKSEGFTYDIISGQEIPNANFDISTHMGIFYGGISGGTDPEFGPLGGE